MNVVHPLSKLATIATCFLRLVAKAFPFVVVTRIAKGNARIGGECFFCTETLGTKFSKDSYLCSFSDAMQCCKFHKVSSRIGIRDGTFGYFYFRNFTKTLLDILQIS